MTTIEVPSNFMTNAEPFNNEYTSDGNSDDESLYICIFQMNKC